jgi:hypothetical protein
MRGINVILITGELSNKSILIGAVIASASVMTRIFIINTITAGGKVGIKDSMASVLQQPLILLPFALLEPLFLPFVLMEPLDRAFLRLASLALPAILLGPRPREFTALGLLVPAVLILDLLRLEFVARVDLVLVFTREPLLLTFVDLQQLVLPFRNQEPLVLALLTPEPPLPRAVNLEKLLLLRISVRNSSPNRV